jgi:hypothetical protein
MKNIHILPTNKPSRLALLHDDKLHIGTSWKKDFNVNPQNIYITNDEEIKEGDKGWLLENNGITKNITQYDCTKGLGGIYPTDKKIILTTDPDLIKDGVQDIDDEFLEWFVKNPSCEKVEVKNYKYSEYPLNYKIIIPQEENEKDFYKIGNFHENCDEGCKYHCTKGNTQIAECLECHFNNTSKEQIENGWEEAGKQTEGINSPTVEEFLEAQTQFKKQETLEEAAENHHINFTKDLSYAETRRDSFIKGAEWQAKRMYSEEEVIEVLTQRCKEFGTKNEKFQKLLLKQDLEWFEQNKKK